MSATVLKCIAMASMLLDHIGYTLDVDLLRYLGRLAFPIFAYLIGNGLRHTSDPKRYLLRLVLLAVVSQVPYTWFLYGTPGLQKLNIFVPLALGLAWLWHLDRCQTANGRALACVLWMGVTVLLQRLVPMDYGYRGVLLIVALGLTAGSRLGMTLSLVGIYFLPQWSGLLQGTPVLWLPNLWALAALPLLFAYNSTPGYTGKYRKWLQWGFYWFYPVHLAVLALIL